MPAAAPPAAHCHLQLAGRAQLQRGSFSADLPDAMPGYLLACLGARGDWVAREELAALLWPDAAAEDAQRSLRVALNRLREKLAGWGVAQALVSERRRVRWLPGSDVVAARAARAAGQWPAVAGIVGAPFAAGLSFRGLPALLAWAEGERQALQALSRDAVQRCAATLPPDQVLALCSRHLDTEPGAEDVLRIQLEALAALGRHAEVAPAYAAFDSRQRADIGIGASAALAAVAARLGAAQPTADDDDSLIGRDAELAAARAALAQHRMLTLTGMGGVGKTRLARALAPPAPSTRWLALEDLAAVADIAHRAWRLLGQTAALGRDPAAQVAALCAQQGLRLLVLDNAEHLLAQRDALCALLSRWLDLAPGLVLLVTSREPLGHAAEQVLPLRALALLPAGAADGLAAPALRLLVAQARRARPAFDARLHHDTLLRIAQHAGGLPLALRIAAQWLRLLSPADVLAALQRSPAGLDGGEAGNLGPSLWNSWRLLDAPAQQALVALALFTSPFSAEDALAGAQVPLPLLARLSDHGLIEPLPATDADTPTRWHLHTLVRAFATERGAAEPAAWRAAQQRHADALRRRLAVWSNWRQVDQRMALQTVGAMLPEALAAWQWALGQGRADFITDTAPVLCNLFERQGRWAEGVALFEAAEAGFDADVPAECAALAALTRSRALLLYRDGRFDAAEALAQRALAWSRALGHGEAVRTNLNTLALARWMLGRLDDALRAAQEAHKLAGTEADRAGLAVAAGTLALVHKKRGDFALAEAAWRDALAVHREVGNWSSATTTLNNLGNLLRVTGRADAAVPLLDESLRLCDAYGFVSNRPFALLNLALAHIAAGRPDAALPLAQRALDEAGRAGERMLEAAARLVLADLALRHGNSALAARHLAPALRQARAIGDHANLLEALATYARWCLAQDRPADAAQARATALAHPALHAELRAELAQGALAALPAAAPADLLALVERAGAELQAAAA